mgnify:CR=1 FL=1
MPKLLIKAAKELNIGVSTIVDYLLSKGYSVERKATFKLTDEMYEDLKLNYNFSTSKKVDLYKNPNDKINPIKADPKLEEDKIKHEIEQSFDKDNPYEIDILSLTKNGIDFEKRKIERKKIGNEFIDTIFSDIEAFSICLGAEENKLRNIANDFFKGEIPSDSNLILAHNSSMNAFQRYGAEYLALVLSLPKLPFKAVDAKQIFSELDIRNKNTTNPAFRIIINDKKYLIKFYEDLPNNFKSKEIAIIQDKTSRETIFYLSRAGQILPNQNVKNIIPTLTLFLRISTDPRTHILNYGLETGECSICGRKLTDPISIKKGIGPICGR